MPSGAGLQLFIDNGDGPVDYTRYVIGPSITITDSLTVPTVLTFNVAAYDAAFIPPVLGAYVQLWSNKNQRYIATGFISVTPSQAFLGSAAKASAAPANFNLYQWAITVASDEYLLNIKSIPFFPSFISQTQGQILRNLANALAPGFFDTSQIQDGDLVSYQAYDPTQKWSDLAKSFGDASGYRYKALNKVLYYVPYGDAALGILYDDTGPQGTFVPDALQSNVLAVPIVNDAIVIGDTEPQNYHDDNFIGDGVSGYFPLRHQLFGGGQGSTTGNSGGQGSGNLLLEEDWTETERNLLQNWTIADPSGAFNLLNGSLQANGGEGIGDSFILANNGVELGGVISFQHGEFFFTDTNTGILGGLYPNAGTDAETGPTECLAGFDIRPNGSTVVVTASGASGIQIQPVVNNGTLIGSPLQVQINHHYILQTQVSVQRALAYNVVYRTLAGTPFGGQSLPAIALVKFLVTDIDLGALNALIAYSSGGETYFGPNPPVSEYSTTYEWDINLNLPSFANYAILNAVNLNLTLNFTAIYKPPQAILTVASLTGNNEIATDNFTREDGPVGGNWAAQEGAFSVVANQVFQTTSGGDGRAAMYWNYPFPPDQYSQLTLSTVPNDNSPIGVGVRHNVNISTLNYYGFYVDQTTAWLIVINSGVVTVLDSAPASAVVGDVLLLTVQGETLTGSINGAPVVTASDGNIGVGNAGIIGYIAPGSPLPFGGSAWSSGTIASFGSGITALPVFPPPGPMLQYLLGFSLENQIATIANVGDYDQLEFYTDTIPAAGARIKLKSWEAGKAIARVQDPANIAQQAVIDGDDGLRTAVFQDLTPLPRSSADCESAAQAEIYDRENPQYQGQYAVMNQFWSPSGQDSPVAFTSDTFQRSLLGDGWDTNDSPMLIYAEGGVAGFGEMPYGEGPYGEGTTESIAGFGEMPYGEGPYGESIGGSYDVGPEYSNVLSSGRWLGNSPFPPNQFSQAVISELGLDTIGVAARMDNFSGDIVDDTYYYFSVTGVAVGPATIELGEVLDGTQTPLADGTYNVNVGDTIAIECLGSQILGLVNGQIVLSITDTDIISGQPGLMGFIQPPVSPLWPVNTNPGANSAFFTFAVPDGVTIVLCAWTSASGGGAYPPPVIVDAKGNSYVEVAHVANYSTISPAASGYIFMFMAKNVVGDVEGLEILLVGGGWGDPNTIRGACAFVLLNASANPLDAVQTYPGTGSGTLTILGASDNFTRADENPLNPAAWTQPSSGFGGSFAYPFQVSGDKCVSTATAPGACGEVYTGAEWENDQFSQITIGTANNDSEVGCIVRYNTSTGFYQVLVSGLGAAQLVYLYIVYPDGSALPIGTFTGPVNSGDTLKLSAVGTTITVEINGSPVIVVNDDTNSSGIPGIGAVALVNADDVAITDWQGGGKSEVIVAYGGGTLAGSGYTNPFLPVPTFPSYPPYPGGLAGPWICEYQSILSGGTYAVSMSGASPTEKGMLAASFVTALPASGSVSRVNNWSAGAVFPPRDGYPISGRFLFTNSPQRSMNGLSLLVTQVTTTVIEMHDEQMQFSLQFGQDLYMSKLLRRFTDVSTNILEPGDTAQSPTLQTLAQIGSTYIDDLPNAQIISVSGNQVMVDLGQVPATGAEVRRSDLGWGTPATNLIGVYTTRQFLLPRSQYEDIFYVRQVNGSVSSRFTSVLRVVAPRIPEAPTGVLDAIEISNPVISLGITGDIRNIRTIEIRAADNQTILFQRTFTSLGDLIFNIDNTTNPILDLTFYCYFVDLMWEYSLPLILTDAISSEIGILGELVGSNLIGNPGFEVNSFTSYPKSPTVPVSSLAVSDGWIAENSNGNANFAARAEHNGEPRTGQYDGEIILTVASISGAPVTGDQVLSTGALLYPGNQYLPVRGGDWYYFGGYARLDTTPATGAFLPANVDGTAYFGLSFFDSSGNFIVAYESDQVTSSTEDDYIYLDTSVQVPYNAASMQFGCFAAVINNGSTVALMASGAMIARFDDTFVYKANRGAHASYRPLSNPLSAITTSGGSIAIPDDFLYPAHPSYPCSLELASSNWDAQSNPSGSDMIIISDNGQSGFVVAKASGPIFSSRSTASRWQLDTSLPTDYAVLLSLPDNSSGEGLIGPAARMDVTGLANYYAFLIGTLSTGTPHTCAVELVSVSGGFFTVLGATTVAPVASGDRIEIKCTGSTIQGLINGTVILTETDTTYISGQPGIAANVDRVVFRTTSTQPITNWEVVFAGSVATVEIAAFEMQAGDSTVSLDAGAIEFLATGTLYYIYYDDPSFSGGDVSYQATTVKEVAISAENRFFVGSITTPVDGGPPTIGNGDGGSGAQNGLLNVLSFTIVSGNVGPFGTSPLGPTLTTGAAVLNNPQNAVDSNPVTFAQIVCNVTGVGPSGGDNEVQLIFGGAPGLSARYYSATLKILLSIEEMDAAPGTVGSDIQLFLYYSLAGVIVSIFTPDDFFPSPSMVPTGPVLLEITLPLNQNLNQLYVGLNALTSGVPTSGNFIVNVYEAWIEAFQ